MAKSEVLFWWNHQKFNFYWIFLSLLVKNNLKHYCLKELGNIFILSWRKYIFITLAAIMDDTDHFFWV